MVSPFPHNVSTFIFVSMRPLLENPLSVAMKANIINRPQAVQIINKWKVSFPAVQWTFCRPSAPVIRRNRWSRSVSEFSDDCYHESFNILYRYMACDVCVLLYSKIRNCYHNSLGDTIWWDIILLLLISQSVCNNRISLEKQFCLSNIKIMTPEFRIESHTLLLDVCSDLEASPPTPGFLPRHQTRGNRADWARVETRHIWGFIKSHNRQVSKSPWWGSEKK